MNGCTLLPGAEFYVAIDNKGLWPKLTTLPNGEIGAAIYNHPSHGYGSGSNIEFWVSADSGRSWEFRSVLSDHSDNPDAIRMARAVGLNAKGELVAFVRGYQAGQKLPFLPLQLCISGDNGLTWQRQLVDIECTPFGNIVLFPDGELLCSLYGVTRTEGGKEFDGTVFSSRDHGRSWGPKSNLGNVNEVWLALCRNGDLLAACRTACLDRMDGSLPHGSGTVLYRSSDRGATWSPGKPLSPQGQECASLLELTDGRLLCCITSRIPGLFGVVFRVSDDLGKTWSVARSLITIPATDWHKTDCGYPSSVQLEDGTIVTAYYFGPKKPEYANETTPWHQRYHMGVARWRL